MTSSHVLPDSSLALDKYITPGEAGTALLVGAAPFLVMGALVIVWLLGHKDRRPPAHVALAVLLFSFIALGGTGGLVFAFGNALRLPFLERMGSFGVVLSLLAIPAAVASAAGVSIAVQVVRVLADNRTAA